MVSSIYVCMSCTVSCDTVIKSYAMIRQMEVGVDVSWEEMQFLVRLCFQVHSDFSRSPSLPQCLCLSPGSYHNQNVKVGGQGVN